MEFPLSTVELFGRRIPFGGGGYFRLYPLTLTRTLILGANRRDVPCMFYIHPYEVGPVIPKIEGLPASRRFRHYYNCGRVDRLRSILSSFPFTTASEVLLSRGFIS